MAMRKASRRQQYGVRDKTDLSESVRAEQASANMYDGLTNAFMKLTDVATTHAINNRIREATLEGEQIGVAATKTNKEGAIEGYEPEGEVFKWDIASNKAAKASFEANVDARSTSALKNLAKEANGDHSTYTNVYKKLVEDAVSTVGDERQRQFIENSYAKAYNQNMHVVSTTGVKLQTKMAAEGWDAGRVSFEDDYGIAHRALLRDKELLQEFTLDGNLELMGEMNDKISKSERRLIEFRKARRFQANGAVALGAVSLEKVDADIQNDIEKAISTTTTQEYQTAYDVEEKAAIRNRVLNMPEVPSVDDTAYMSPRAKSDLLKALDDQELHEQKMWKSEIARAEKEFFIDKTATLGEINVDMLDDTLDGQTLNKLSEAIKLGYIDEKEYQDYKERILNGTSVSTDDMQTYAGIKTNIQNWSASAIAGRKDLTDASMRSLIGARQAWEEEGAEWMTSPAYNKGDDYIRDTYKFPKKGIMPEFLTQESRDKYTEMIELQAEYTELVRDAFAKNERYNGYDIARELVKNQKDDLTSKLKNEYVDHKLIKSKALEDEAKKTHETLNAVMTRQIERNPDTYYDATRSGQISDQFKAEGKGFDPEEFMKLSDEEKRRALGIAGPAKKESINESN